MLALESFITKQKPYQPWSGRPPPYVRVERLCLMFGLALLNVWKCGQCATSPELIGLDKVPTHVVDGIHRDVQKVSSLISPAILSLENSLDQPVAGPSKVKAPSR